MYLLDVTGGMLQQLDFNALRFLMDFVMKRHFMVR
jgi:hypothetical protein